ncbi:baseplate J/gp47 family protein [Candidatus Dojkabacteria bacterium]|jgi:hypothetical protein|nr:baseplate J/gp47 family protein [Candidatus Dojkabacteria bacterium]
MEAIKGKNVLEIEKIVVSGDDELIDILKELEESNSKKIILTFTEPTDILISPINLKVILEQADELTKPLIALIVQNPTGIRNAREIGMTATETSGSILDSFWEEAEREMNERIKEKEVSLKKRKIQKKASGEGEIVGIVPEVEAIEKVKPKIDSKSEFQKNIEDALSKSTKSTEGKKKVINENGLMIGIDSELEQKTQPEGTGPSMIGKNIRTLPVEEEGVQTKRNIPVKIPKINFKKIRFPKFKMGLFLKIFLPIISVIIIALALAYIFLPFVKLNIFVQSKQVAIEKTFTGDITVTELSIENGKVPVKKETVAKDTSDTIKASGTGYKGTKAQGMVVFTYWDLIHTNTPLNLPAETKITSSKGYTYTTNTAVIIGTGGDPTSSPVPVTATAVGEEFNIIKGDFFTVTGYTQTVLSAINNDTDFTGGTKTSYTILSLADVTKSSDALKKLLFDQSVEDLNVLNVEGWKLIDSTIVKKLDGEVVTDIPIGAEADDVNVTVRTKVTGLFYQFGLLDGSINKMLTDKADNENLFTGNNSTLVFSQNITKDIKVTGVKKEVATIFVKASSWIRPEINKEDLIKELKGKGWNKGIDVLKSKSYMAKDAELTFQPTYFPAFLRYFPTTQGRIYISIEKVDSSAE